MGKELVGISRRDFLKATGKGAGVLALFSAVPFRFLMASENMKRGSELLEYDKIGWGACTVNCGSLCGLKLFIKDNKIAWVETDNEDDDADEKTSQVRACVRGRSTRYRVYSPLRLKYPMKRVGKRGEGKFVRISWDEALETIANKMKDIKARYGNEAFYIAYGTGVIKGTLSRSWPQGASVFARLMNVYGGYLNHYNDYSAAQIESGLDAFYGGWGAGSDISGVEYSDLLVMFGNNTVETRMSGGGANYYLMKAMEKGKTPCIYIDPRYSDTAAARADEWVAVRPATDAALVAGIANVLIKEGMHNQAFLDKYCQGFDAYTLPKDAPKNASYKDYILGTGEDGIEKTPLWASKITGVPEEQIIRVARRIGKAKRPFIAQGWGPQRHSNGEQVSRAIATLACMKGFGVLGTNSGAREGASSSLPLLEFPVGANPVKKAISVFMWTDAIYRGKDMTDIADGVRGAAKLDVPIKFIWSYGANMMNQHAHFKKTAEILSDESQCEMIVDVNTVLSASGRYADILLPDATHFEQLDYSFTSAINEGTRPYVVVSTKAIEPLFESKTVYDMTLEISKRLGLEKEFSEGRTRDEWITYLWEESRKKVPGLPSMEEMKTRGIYKGDPVKPAVAYEAFIQDPKKNKLPTPSGKIEIYSTALAEKKKTWVLPKDQRLDALPIHWDSPETYNDAKRQKYPLQCFGYHYKGRTHSSFWESEAVREVNPQYAWINPLDAKARGIEHGSEILIFNERGTVKIKANVTSRVRPGVITFPQGGWYEEKNGIDVGGCINTLSSIRPTALSKGNGTHSILVDVKRAS